MHQTQTRGIPEYAVCALLQATAPLQDQNCERGALLKAALPVCRGRNVAYVREDVKLDVVFKEFMSSANHMLLVRREPTMPGGPDGDVTGLITLEDVMEELIGVSRISELSRMAI